MAKVTTYKEGPTQRRILLAVIMNDVVLGKVATRWQRQPFEAPWCNIIYDWCLQHFRRYQQAPRQNISGYFYAWAETNPDEATLSLVEQFLVVLSQEYERSDGQINVDYMVDTARGHFRRTALVRLKETLERQLASGNVEEAENQVINYARVEAASDKVVDLFIDQAAVYSTFAKASHDPLITYPDALGSFFYNSLERGRLLSFLGCQKSGKTFWLVDLAWRAMLERKRVAFFEIGDLSEQEIYERLLVRANAHPTVAPDGKWPYTVRHPNTISYTKGEDHATLTVQDLEFTEPLDARAAWIKCEQVMRLNVRSKRSFFKIGCFPNLSITVLGLQSLIQSWRLEEWVPDVVIIDYADNLAPVNHKAEPREQVNVTWKYLSAMAKSLDCLLITATQSNAKGFTQRTLDRSNFSEDNRKLSHVNGMIGISMTAEEKALGLSRLNWIVKREGEYSTYRCCHVASCLPLANPAILSTW